MLVKVINNGQMNDMRHILYSVYCLEKKWEPYKSKNR